MPNEAAEVNTEDQAQERPYEMTLNLNVLHHLGIGLYSNSVAVLTEVVANSFDADADWVNISIDGNLRSIIIRDNGAGMSREDINRRFLHVGYGRRADPQRADGSLTTKGRRVMGRKGLGKLSLFSIAHVIEVYTKRAGFDPEAFSMDTRKIEAQIGGDGKDKAYYPDPIDFAKAKLPADFQGTEIRLYELKSARLVSKEQLRQRLARRFAITGALANFAVKVDGTEISAADRNYLKKLQYIWIFGSPDHVKELRAECVKFKNISRIIELDGTIEGSGYTVDGWIGTAAEPSNLAAKSSSDGENQNSIILLARGRPIQENILDRINDGRLYSKYIIGEVNADFLDDDAKPDIATSSRQSVIEDDERAVIVYAHVTALAKKIANQWTDLRNQDGENEAITEIPKLKVWLDNLKGDTKKSAGRLLARIRSLPIEDEQERRTLYRHGLLAFERLRVHENLAALDALATFDANQFSAIVSSVDEIEGAVYLEIVRERLAIIRTLNRITDENALEAEVQKLIAKHMWLVEPSWERGTDAVYVEEVLGKTFRDATTLTGDEEKARLDIRYKRGPDSHLIIELKRSERKDLTYDLLYRQGRKYALGLRKGLQTEDIPDPYIEVIFLLGSAPRKELDSDVDMFEKINARYITYKQMVINAQKVYGEYIKERDKNSTLRDVIEALSPSAPPPATVAAAAAAAATATATATAAAAAAAAAGAAPTLAAAPAKPTSAPASSGDGG
ncbi:BbrUII/HgiDII family restriction enzyme [Achromobacter xylosoxidans]|uniref:BbrUII/HgiDII family restriction enzyme n=1 Tax=Alcaligenes xylosoxydans xylosoxydans TaxID=85698 RepID=UPI000FDA7937|nr:ATP-binding protein [Achromobacter xylosoxidans]